MCGPSRQVVYFVRSGSVQVGAGQTEALQHNLVVHLDLQTHGRIKGVLNVFFTGQNNETHSSKSNMYSEV